MISPVCLEAGPHPQPLSARQQDVLSVIQRYYAAVGEGASVSFIARRLDITVARAHQQVETLYRKGWLVSRGSPATPRPWLASPLNFS